LSVVSLGGYIVHVGEREFSPQRVFEPVSAAGAAYLVDIVIVLESVSQDPTVFADGYKRNGCLPDPF
jgi:hypothetical protein